MPQERIRRRFSSECADVVVGNPPWGFPKKEEAEAWVDTLVEEADARAVQIRLREYMVWTRTMERLLFEFTVHAGKISERSQEISVQVRDWPMIEQQAWENLARGLREEKTWFFVVDFRSFFV